MRQTIYVKDAAMVLALEEAKLLLEVAGIKHSPDKIQERREWYQKYIDGDI